MTTPKEALEQIIAIPNRDYGSDWDEIEEAREIARKALASFEGDAVERVARIMVRYDPNYCIYHMPGDTPRDWKATSGFRGDTSELSESAAESVRARARRILASGLAPDEAAVRADEREKCAAQFQGKDIWTVEAIAAAIRSGGAK